MKFSFGTSTLLCQDLKDLKLCFRNFALSLLPKIRSSAFPTSARPGLERSRSSSTLVLPGLINMGKSTSAFHLCQDFQRSEIPLPHFCFALTAKDVKFCISSLPGLPKMWSSASALLLCLDCQRSEVPLSVLPLGQDLERSRSSFTLVLPGLPSMGKSTSAIHLSPDFQICEIALPHFALPWLPKIWSSAFRNSARPGLERSRSSSTLVLPGLPNMDKSTSAFHLCQDFQRSEIPLPHFCFALTAKDVKFCFLSSAVRSCYAFPHKFVRL